MASLVNPDRLPGGGQPLVHIRRSFTLITGILARTPVPTGTAASPANGALESFVRAAAIDIAPQRVNAVSPTVFTDAPRRLRRLLGFPSVDLADVAQADIRSIVGAQTGQVFELG